MESALFAVLPILALVSAVVGGLYRYVRNPFSYSSLSSQSLENRSLFWGSVPWHYGIILILLAHLAGGLVPRGVAWVLASPVRLALLEVLGLALALYTAVGLGFLVARRVRPGAAPRVVTSPMDGLVLFLLALQVATGIFVALAYRWGSRWYLATAVPWFWSIVGLRPDTSTVSLLPFLVQVHFVNGFLLIGLFPFTRLVHLVTVPLGYLWRPYQIVIWDRRPEGRGAGATDDDPPDPDRRRWLHRVSLGAGLVAAALVAAPVIRFLLGLRRRQEIWRAIGRVESFAVGKTVEVSFADPSPLPWAGVTARTAAWLRRDGEQDFVAFSVNCTHLGCPVRWLSDAELFMCPCHGGVYYQDGSVASGPPPRSLFRYPVRLRDGSVEILTRPLPIA